MFVKENCLMKQFKDRVHGFIELYPGEVEIVNSQIMQRMRHIKQTGFAYFVYPSANHSRFEHSLGVCHIAGKMIQRVIKSAEDRGLLDNWISAANVVFQNRDGMKLITDKNNFKLFLTKITRIGGLVHDIGHLFYSHTAEQGLQPILWDPPASMEIVKNGMIDNDPAFRPLPSDKLHEFIGHKIIITHLKEIISRIPEFNQTIPKFLFDLLEAKDSSDLLRVFDPVRRIIDGELDADRLDYVLRDADAAGLAAGAFELDRIIQNIMLWENNDIYSMIFNIKAEGAIATCLVQRHFLYRQMYQHPLVSMYDFCMGVLTEVSLLKIFDANPKDLELFYKRLYFAELHSFKKNEEPKYNSENTMSDLPILQKWNIVSDDIWIETLFKYYFETFNFEDWQKSCPQINFECPDYRGFTNNQAIVQDPVLLLEIYHKRKSPPIALWKNYHEFQSIVVDPIRQVVIKYIQERFPIITFPKNEDDIITSLYKKFYSDDFIIEDLVDKIMNDAILDKMVSYKEDKISKYNKFDLQKYFKNCVDQKEKLPVIPENFFIVSKSPLRYDSSKSIHLYTDGEDGLLDISQVDPFVNSMKSNKQFKPFFYLFVQHENRDELKKSIPILRDLVTKTLVDIYSSTVVDDETGEELPRMEVILELLSIPSPSQDM